MRGIGAEGAQDSVLAHHVVRPRAIADSRRTPQSQRQVTALDFEHLVRVSCGDASEFDGVADCGAVFVHEAAEPVDVDQSIVHTTECRIDSIMVNEAGHRAPSAPARERGSGWPLKPSCGTTG